MRLTNRSVAAFVTVAFSATASLAGAQDVASKLSVHGYLTQGAAVSDSGMVVGISKQGTTNYRRAAILMRYAQSPRDAFVIQVAHRALGESPTMNYEPDVKLDWAFYERKFMNQSSSLRVGKAPIPFGIYNETRYTGTLLPFYRAPYAMYFEGAYTSETVDGAVLSHTFLGDSPFHVDASVYGGSYDLLEYSQVPVAPGAYKFMIAQAQARGALGGQAWINTPIDGFRVGGGASRATMDGGLLRSNGRKETKRDWNVGVDGAFDRFAARGEYRGTIYKNLTYHGYYGQVGARVVGPLSLNAQGEVGTAMARNGATYRELEIPLIRDYAVGANYAFRSDLVFKLEAHRTKDYDTEENVNIFANNPGVAHYYISSLSLSF
ncbi:MAG TPA: hypothetical protein VFJ74_16875 [Gemmatimonadaceae bacterium]|nr:hypothetical protein [Gemmatimonadaceae bacterium]